MKKLISYVVIMLLPFYFFGQEKVDSSLWELIIPVSISDAKPLTTNIISLGRKDFLNLPASFDDPSRLVTRYPGFTNANDQNNSIVYHGMPSFMSGWTLYNSEIINPNHLNTAGNFFDGYTPASGGVNAFSAQVIGEYSYRANPDTHHSNDYFAGVSNMNLRTPYKNSINLNTSLIGMELGLDVKNDKFDFLFNSRYSTVGLLSLLGLDFGDEEITYGDAMMKLGIQAGKGKFNLYGLYGSSENNKEAIPESEAKDIIEASSKNLESLLFIAGINYEIETSKGLFETTTNYSTDEQIIETNNRIRRRSAEINNVMLSNSTSLTRYYGNWDVEYNLRTKFYGLYKPSSWLSQLSVFSRYYRSNHVIFDFGISGMHNRMDFAPIERQNFRFNPSFGLNLISKDYQHTFRFKFSRNQQLAVIAPVIHYNTDSFPSSYNFLLEYKSQNQNLVMSAFYHYFDEVYQNPGIHDNYVYFDDYERIESISFGDIAASTAHIYGASFSLSQNLNENVVFKFNTTVLRGYQRVISNFFSGTDFTYENIPIPYSLRFNNNLVLSWDKFIRDPFQFSFSVSMRDGQRAQEVGDRFDPYSVRLPYYFRADARLNYRLDKGKYKSMLSLDMQNLTNRKNISGQYFDDIAGEIRNIEQLGFIPVLSWRVVL